MTKLALLKKTPLIQVIDEPIYPLYLERFGKLKVAFMGAILFAFLTVCVLFIKKVSHTATR